MLLLYFQDTWNFGKGFFELFLKIA